MNNFTFHTPTEIVFGKGVESQAGEMLKKYGATKVMVHYGGGSVKRSGLLDRVEASLKGAGIDYVMFGGAQPNPRVSLVREGAEIVKKEGVDFILAVGGGSAIDSGKGISIAVANEADVWDIFKGEAEQTAALPTANILTLAAAGSETSNSTVLTNDSDDVKIGYDHQLNRPVFTLMNPELTYTLPPYQTSCGIVDIMMHTLDRYFSYGGKNELTDVIAEAVLRNVILYGPLALREPENYDARSELMWTGSVSHNGLTGCGKCGDFSPHMLGHELSGKYDVAHGASLAAVWGSWARYVYDAEPSRFARYGAEVWGLVYDYENPANTALAAIEATERFFRSIGMPISLPEIIGRAATAEEIDDMAEKCTRSGKKVVGNFKELRKKEITEIYNIANK